MTKTNWREHEIMWVVGCIGHDGLIVATPLKEGRTHTQEESRGTRWRWFVWEQDWKFLRANEFLTHEEELQVLDWLIERGYAEESCWNRARLNRKP